MTAPARVLIVKLLPQEGAGVAALEREADLRFFMNALHNAKLLDSCEVWTEGRRVMFDPLAHDGEHEGHDSVLWYEPYEADDAGDDGGEIKP